ncbi:MAG TPA: sigma-54-dependent Fis family transcriptional regulator, partial [Alcaligenes faecalis]|nr:sigma-54-dependent Fis family transcriptional regulator [Alcaligenes faecalis]
MSVSFMGNEPVLYVWEGSSDLVTRAERAMEPSSVAVMRVEPSLVLDAERHPTRHAVALVSVSVMAQGRFEQHQWLVEHAIPVIWVASEDRGYDPRFYPSAYSYTLPLSFSQAELRTLVAKLAGLTAQVEREGQGGPQPLVAVSPVMRALIAEADMYADSGASV